MENFGTDGFRCNFSVQKSGRWDVLIIEHDDICHNFLNGSLWVNIYVLNLVLFIDAEKRI